MNCIMIEPIICQGGMNCVMSEPILCQGGMNCVTSRGYEPVLWNLYFVRGV